MQLWWSSYWWQR